ncbi:hypothetical protein BDW59DRAFT_168529 [Aspergillus cavernicola]|uniref:Uncharacterized protein n=1 Tax=Aspergillus cavernicola TaxID=176166 RepID=A0ABR4J5M7_9EURO
MECRGAQPAAQAAELLDTAKIPYVSFGWLTIALLSFDAGLGEVEFVVRDQDSDAAREALVDEGFHLCKDPNCRELLNDRCPPSQDRPQCVPAEEQRMTPSELDAFFALNAQHLIADAHFHLDFQYEKCTVLSLYKKSSILRWIPVLEADPRNDDPSFLWLSNDSARLPEARLDGPSGPWTQLYPVRFLNPTSFCETLLLLLCRDYGHVKCRDFSWRTMWETLVENQVPLNRPLRLDFKPMWEAAEDFLLQCMPTSNHFKLMSECRRQLIANGEIIQAEIPELDESRMH